MINRWVRRWSGIPTAFAFVCAFCWAQPIRATIRYEVSLDHPEKHLFQVSMIIPDVTGEVTVQMPAWNALYQIRDFSSHVRQVEAFVENAKAPIEKVDKQTWHITATGTVTVRYATYWDEPGPFATQLNMDHAFINPAMILMFVPGRCSEATQLFLPDVPQQWEAAGATLTMLESTGAARNFVFGAKGYDKLADGPIEAGKFDEYDLSGVSPRITVVVHGDNWKRGRIEEDLKRICQYELRLMGGAPFEHYTFILHIGKAAAGGVGGGMEHANSTAIGVSSDEFLPGVAAHEFFHLWNVERIRPASLEPVDYSKEQYTRALWFAEGVTSTYASYTLVRSGIWSKARFYEDLGEQISELEARPANRWQSAEQSSLDAWLEKYQLYNRPEYSVSYYTKGQVLGVLLDILIRDRTNNERSLDEVLRAMNEEFAKKGKPYRDSLDVRLMVEQVAGGSFEEFFHRHVAAAEALPYRETLSLAGLELHGVERRRAVLGFTAERDASGAVIVRDVEAGSSAARADLRPGDAILSWNGKDVPRSLARWLREQKAGDLLRLRVRREEQEVPIELRLGGAVETLYQVAEESKPTEKALSIREGLLNGVTRAAAKK